MLPFESVPQSRGVAERLLGVPPDILDCMASLSNDEVSTPPWLANKMLDTLPADVWTNPHYRWLDPSSKSGVLLREIVKRLLYGVPFDDPLGRTPTPGLTIMISDENVRRNHIFRRMVWGLSVTDLTGEISRRTIYYTPEASSPLSVVPMAHVQGNVRFVHAEHKFVKDGSCSDCKAPQSLERGSSRENYAYAFIHNEKLPEGYPVKFDVIVGNPPYQLNDGGGKGNSAVPIYQKFVERAIKMEPRYIVMITPSRWFAGGKGLDAYRKRMLGDRRLRTLVDYPDWRDCFPDAKVRGGVSYFLWNRDEEGPCAMTTVRGTEVSETVERELNAYDVLIRDSEALTIVEKIRAQKEPDLAERVSSRMPFGISAAPRGSDSRTSSANVMVYGNKVRVWVEREAIPKNIKWVDSHKVIMQKAYGEDGVGPFRVLPMPTVAEPGTACTETYLVLGCFESKDEADNFAAYVSTKFVRFLVLLRLPTQNITKGSFGFVPDLPMTQCWTDADLYERYDLTEREIAFIERHIKAMPVATPAVEDESGAPRRSRSPRAGRAA